jgi:hypothetical protein
MIAAQVSAEDVRRWYGPTVDVSRDRCASIAAFVNDLASREKPTDRRLPDKPINDALVLLRSKIPPARMKWAARSDGQRKRAALAWIDDLERVLRTGDGEYLLESNVIERETPWHTAALTLFPHMVGAWEAAGHRNRWGQRGGKPHDDHPVVLALTRALMQAGCVATGRRHITSGAVAKFLRDAAADIRQRDRLDFRYPERQELHSGVSEE